MYFIALLPVISALTGLSLAQAINPDSVSIQDREQWCTAQITSCPLLCLQFPGSNAGTTSNDCDPKTLDYSCVCQNGQSPNASQYSQTIPYFECTETNNQCVSACGQDNACSNDCVANHPCGAQNPKRVNTSTITTTQSKTAAATDSGSAATGAAATSEFATLGAGGSQATASSGDGTNANGDSGAQALAINVGRTWGLTIVLGGIFAGVALVL